MGETWALYLSICESERAQTWDRGSPPPSLNATSDRGTRATAPRATAATPTERAASP